MAFPHGTIVDLTLLLAEELPCTWPGHMPYQQKTFNFFEDGGTTEAHLQAHCGSYQTRWLLIDEHTGTHMDAPAHFLPGSHTDIDGASEVGDITAEYVPLEQLMGPAVVIDIEFLLDAEMTPGVSPAITADHIRDFEQAHGEIAAGDIVLFRSRWDEKYYRAGIDGRAYAHDGVILKTGPAWPAPIAETLDYLISKGVRCVGTDGPSMGSAHDGSGVHLAGLGNGAIFIEALGNLGALPTRGADFIFAPLKVARGSGAPGRAFAFV